CCSSQVGSDVILPCLVKPPVNVRDAAVEWMFDSSKTVHLFRNEADDRESQDDRYKGRTYLNHTMLELGNISLKLSNVTKNDEGIYSCFVHRLPDLSEEKHVTLIVGEPRPIVVKFLRYKDRSTILQSTKALKGSKIFINEDFTDAVRKRRAELMPDLRAARQRGDILLCRTGLTGRCYWEVEWRGEVYISVSYRRIRRKGDSGDCVFGYNDHSWSLNCSDDFGYSVWHNNIETRLSSSSVSNRVAVYVDCPAGILSFYRVSSDSLILLHTFNTTFTEPLIPGFRFWSIESKESKDFPPVRETFSLTFHPSAACPEAETSSVTPHTPTMDCSPCCPLERGSAASGAGPPGSETAFSHLPSDC
uniref:B30.2/SPRY domain-containing protein n=1 Tax=Xiphophorus couchianus TaxID=32473 RepID=A0A3B5LSP2_9TELE